jgi:hypothetical protein
MEGHAVTDCARGCTIARKHVTDCPDQDACKGCQPREAAHGLLCKGCHLRLVDWLTNAPGQYALLKIAATPSLSQAMQPDAIHASTYGAPTPLNIAAASTMTDLTDILSCWVEMLADQHGMRGPAALMTRNGIENPQGRQLNPRWSFFAGESVWCDPPVRFEIHAACLWLRAQIERLEVCPGIGDLWGELGEVMSQAHCLAPWREEAARLRGIECPECHSVSLVRYGGDSHVTCQRCNAHIEPGRYAIWVRLLTATRKQATSVPPSHRGTLTFPEAAGLLGISPFTVKSWYVRDQLRPIREGAKPLLFREVDVLECHRARMSAAMHARLDALWAEILADFKEAS